MAGLLGYVLAECAFIFRRWARSRRQADARSVMNRPIVDSYTNIQTVKAVLPLAP